MHPVLWTFHSWTVYSYGFFVALAMLLVFFLSLKRAPKAGFSKDYVSDLVFLLFVAGVAGARAFYVLQHLEEYASAPLKVFSVQEGGLVWYGGFLTAVFAGALYSQTRKLPSLRLLDFFTPFVPLGHALGRAGCFLNGCCFGRFTESSWGVRFPGESAARIPVQLYEAAFLVALSFFLFSFYSRKHREGEVFVAYLGLYGIGRFALEFFRGDQRPLFSLTIPQWWSLFLFLAAVFLMFFLRKKPGRGAV